MQRGADIDEEGSPVLGHIPTMPSEEVMKAELAIMTGGRDQDGKPIITIPSKQFGIIKSTVLEEVIKYYIAITRPQVKHAGFGFVVDFSRANEMMIDVIVATLNTVQAQLKGAVAMLYAVSPIIKDLRKHMLAKLGLRKSKKAKYKSMPQPLFKSTAHYNISDLYNYVDKSNLTQDLGGYMNYDHQAWVKFRKVFEPFYRDAEDVIKRIPTAFQQLTALSDIPKAKSLEEIQQTKTLLQQENEDIIGELGLEPVLSQCNSLLSKLKKPDDNSIFVAMAQKPMFKDILHITERYHDRLTGAEQKADVLFQKTMRKVNQSLQHLQFESNLNQLIDWINNKGIVYLRTNVEIPDSLSRSEILKHHFETGFLTSAKEVIHHGESLLQQADEMVIKDHYNIPVILATSKNFMKVLQQFKDSLHRRHQILHHCYVFYLLMEKCLQWYRKTLTFLPPELLDYKEFFVSPSGHHGRHPYLMTLEWREESRRFLRKHPPPSNDELQRLKDSVLLVKQMKVRTQARLLVHRCLRLKYLFLNKDKVSPKELLKILQWQTNYLEGYDDIELYDDDDSEEGGDAKVKASGSPKQKQKLRDKSGKNYSRRRNDDDDDGGDGSPNKDPDRGHEGEDHNDRYDDTYTGTQGNTAPENTQHGNYQRQNKLHVGDQNESDVADGPSAGKRRMKSKPRIPKTRKKSGRRYSDTHLYRGSDADPERLGGASPRRMSDTSPKRVRDSDANLNQAHNAPQSSAEKDMTASDRHLHKKHVSISPEKPDFFDERTSSISMPNLHQPQSDEADSQNQTYGIYGDSDDMEGMLNGPPRNVAVGGGGNPGYQTNGTQYSQTQWPYNTAPSQQLAQTRWTSSDAVFYNQSTHPNANYAQAHNHYSSPSTAMPSSLSASQTPKMGTCMSHQYPMQNGPTYASIPANGLQYYRHISPSNTDSGYTQSSPNLSGNTTSSLQDSPPIGADIQTPHLASYLARSMMATTTAKPGGAPLQNQSANQAFPSQALTNQLARSNVNPYMYMQRTMVPQVQQQYLSTGRPVYHYQSVPPRQISPYVTPHTNPPGLPLSANQPHPAMTSLPTSANRHSVSHVNQLTTPQFMSTPANEQRATAANQFLGSVLPTRTLPSQITANDLRLPIPNGYTPTAATTPINFHLPQTRRDPRLRSYLTPLEKLELEVHEDRKTLEREMQNDGARRGQPAPNMAAATPQVPRNARRSDLRSAAWQAEMQRNGQSHSQDVDMDLLESSLVEQLSNFLTLQSKDDTDDNTSSRQGTRPTLARNMSSDGVVSGTESDPALQEYKTMLDEARKLRLASEESLLEEKRRYEILRLQQEELTQTEVEESLKRSEKLLQEEEDVIQQEEELDKLIKMDDERQQWRSPRQPSPRQPTAQIRTSMSLEEELKTLERQEQRLQRRVLRRGSSLQLSDEGIVLDNASPDDLADRGSLGSSSGSGGQKRSRPNAFGQLQDLDTDELVAFIESERKERRGPSKVVTAQNAETTDESSSSTTQEKITAQKLLQGKLKDMQDDWGNDGTETKRDENKSGEMTDNDSKWGSYSYPEVSVEY